MPDPEFLAYAAARELIVVTCNRDAFVGPARAQPHRGQIILFRCKSRTAECAAGVAPPLRVPLCRRRAFRPRYGSGFVVALRREILWRATEAALTLNEQSRIRTHRSRSGAEHERQNRTLKPGQRWN